VNVCPATLAEGKSDDKRKQKKDRPMADTSYVKTQLVYWGQVTAAGVISNQAGPGLMTLVLAASVYTFTLPANFTVPINRRFVVVTTNNPVGTPGSSASYDAAASAAGTVVVRGAAFGGGALDTAFDFQVFRVEIMA
jgi:hypothetical protein